MYYWITVYFRRFPRKYAVRQDKMVSSWRKMQERKKRGDETAVMSIFEIFFRGLHAAGIIQ